MQKRESENREKRGKYTYILAEMASSHEGKREIAKFIIDKAAEAKADGILLQLIDLNTYIVPSDDDFQMVKSIYLSRNVWTELIERCNMLGLDVWANVYDEKSAEFCGDKEIRGFKLHSANLDNESLVRKVVQSKKEILLSVGGMKKSDVKRILGMMRSINKRIKVRLMYGLQNFPTNPDDINLNFVKELSQSLNVPFGYQDHSKPTSLASTYLPILCVAQGAGIIEKHITHNRALKGKDYQSALNPEEFSGFVKDIRVADNILSRKADAVSLGELKYRNYKSLIKVVARENIERGEAFSENNLAAMRSKKGEISGKKLEALLERKSKSSYEKFEPIKIYELM